MSPNIYPESTVAKFASLFGGKPRIFRAPGRINIIGEHTDYNEGLVLPSTVDVFTWAVAAPNENGAIRIHTCHDGNTYHLGLESPVRGGDGKIEDYLKGVAWALLEEGISLTACDVVIAGNIPLGGGLSSSASLELVLASALLDSAGVDMPPARLAAICQRAESEFVGMQCGIMDQYAIALGRSGQAMLLDCRALEYEMIDHPPGAGFIVVHSGVSHKLPDGEYNSRREECAQALSGLRSEIPGLGSLSELDMDQLRGHAGLLNDRLFRRCRHVLTENRRVLAAATAMRQGQLEQLGSLLNESHESLRDDYEVSCPELDQLVDIANNCEAVLGSRMMGGGFGGCTINLVRQEAVHEVSRHLLSEYSKLTGNDPWMHVVGPAGPVARIG